MWAAAEVDCLEPCAAELRIGDVGSSGVVGAAGGGDAGEVCSPSAFGEAGVPGGRRRLGLLLLLLLLGRLLLRHRYLKLHARRGTFG